MAETPLSPSYYKRGTAPVWDFIRDQGLNFHLGNAIKYICRAGYKGSKEEDLEKVEQVKIEYEAFEYTKHSITELTNVLDNSGFEYIIYRIDPKKDRYSNSVSGHLFGRKN